MSEEDYFEYLLFELVKNINKMCDSAVSHGGDAGGPYYCDYDALKKDMIAIAKKLTNLFNYDFYVVDSYDHLGRTIKNYTSECFRYPLITMGRKLNKEDK